jgi:hypothetical protein
MRLRGYKLLNLCEILTINVKLKGSVFGKEQIMMYNEKMLTLNPNIRT